MTQKNAAEMSVEEFRQWIEKSHSRIYNWLHSTQGRSGLISSENAKKRASFVRPVHFTNQTRRAMNRGKSAWRP